jgi:hypothetical protein
MARRSRATGAGVTQAVEARDARDRLAQMGEVAAQFSDFRPRAEVIRNVEAVPTIFPWYDHVTGVGGHPISRFALVHGPANEGKMLSNETPILTPDGWMLIGDAKVGDSVIGSDGAPTTIIGVFPQGVLDLYWVTFSDGFRIEAGAEHLWQTTTDRERNRGRYVRGPRPNRKRIATGVVGSGSVKTTARIRETLDDGHSIPVLTGPVQYRAVGNLVLDPYCLGLLLGDGTLTGMSPRFSKPEDDVQSALERSLPGDDTLSRYAGGMDCGIVGGETKRQLTQLGLWGCRSWEKFIPELYLRASPVDRLALLRGLLDTDGSVDQHGTGIEYTTTSFELARQVIELARSLGAIVHEAERTTNYAFNGESKAGRPSKRLKIVFCDWTVPVSSEKHLAKWKRTRREQHRRIVSIEWSRKAEATCIAVAARDRLYVADGFVVTHNTEFCLGLIASFLQRYHFAGLVDAERTTTDAWVRSLMGDLADHQGFSALPVGTYEQVRVGVRNYCETIANARAKGKLSPETSGVIVVDSIRKLVPKKLWDELAKAKAADEDDAKPSRGKRKKAPTGVDGIGGRAGQIKAALNAAWVDELVPLLADTRMAMVVIARETEDPDADVWASKTWKIGGGTALFYEASLDIRITRGWIKAGDVVIGEKHRLEIHKTKIAGKMDRIPEAWFHVANGVSGHVGFDRPRDVIALGLEIAAIQADGSWIKWGKTTLGQGVESAVARLHKDADLLVRVEDDVRALSAKSRVTSSLI